MRKLFALTLLVSFPILATSQIYKVFEVKSHDTIQFEGNVLKLPAVKNVYHIDYLIELDGTWEVTKMTIDALSEGIVVYGYSVNADGNFHELVRTNSTDQVYNIGVCIQYLLIRLESKVNHTVNFDFEMR